MKKITYGLLIALLAAGCAEPRRATVEGLVTLDGKPLAEVEVQFIPELGRTRSAVPASGYTDETGRYRIEASGSSGVSVGPNRVCINDARLMMPAGGSDPNDGLPVSNRQTAPRRSRVPDVYGDANRTPFRNMDIQPGRQTIDFPLKLRP